jgi:RNA polymerase sigma-70 factor (ECF subfamily)
MKNFGKHSDNELYAFLRETKEMAEGAFAELYRRHSQKIYAYIIRVLGNSEETNDIFQEVMLKFFDSAKEGQKIDNIPAFLIIITRNLCLNHKRDKKTILRFDDFDVYSNDKSYEHKEMLDLIASSLELLEFDFREAFVLRQYQGFSYKEISEITGDSIQVVKNKVWRAKEKIKSILEPYLQDMSN